MACVSAKRGFLAPKAFAAAPTAYVNAPLYAAGASRQIDVRHNYDGTLSSYTTTPFGYAGPYSGRYIAGAAHSTYGAKYIAQAAYAAPYATAYASPYAAAPYAAAYASPYAAPFGAAYGSPYVASYAAPYHRAAYAAPYAAPVIC